MGIYMKNSVILLVSLLVFACSRGGSPVCVYGDDFGDVITKNIEMKAEGVETSPGSKNYVDRGWINTGVTVQNKRSLQIATLGNIQLCSAQDIVKTVVVPGNKNDWVDTGIDIATNLSWSIKKIEGTITTSPSSPKIAAKTISNGEQLYVYVGDFSQVTDKVNWWGTGSILTENSDGTYISDYSTGSYFFYGITPSSPPVDPVMSLSGFSYSGRLYFRLHDSTGVKDKTHPWGMDTEYENNQGSYLVTVVYKKSCAGKNGQFLEASIGEQPGMSGRIKDMSTYAASINGEPEGTFNNYAWASGTLWLKISDDTRTTWGGLTGQIYGDGDFTPIDLAAAPPTGSNYGSYFVTIVTTKPFDDGINSVINKIIDPIKKIMYGDPSSNDPTKYGLTKRMYLGLTGNINFIAAVRAALVLSIIFFALSYMLGLKAVNTQDFIMYALKVSFVVILIGPYSWTFFYDHLFTVFINGVEELVWIMSGQFGDTLQKADRFSDSAIRGMFVDNAHITPDISKMFNLHVIYNGQEGVLYGDQARHIDAFFIPNDDPSFSNFSSGLPISIRGQDGVFQAGVLFDPDQLQKNYKEASHNAFAFLNQTVSSFFTQETNIKIAALFSAFPLGPVFILLIYAGMVFFLMGVLRAVVMYMLSIVMTGLLLFLAPIFITFLLFPLLKGLFDGYIKQLIGYVIQPVMMFTMISIFNVFIYSIFHSLLSYSVCWGCVWHIDFPFNKWLNVSDNFDRFCIFEGYRPWGMMTDQTTASQTNKFPLTLFSAFIFVIFGSALDKFLDWVVTFGNQVSGGGTITSLAGKTGEIMAGAKNTAVAMGQQTIAQARPILGFGARQGTTLKNYISTKAAKSATKRKSATGGGVAAPSAQEKENQAHFAELPFAAEGARESESTNANVSQIPASSATPEKSEPGAVTDLKKLQGPKTQAEDNRDTFLEAFGGGAFFGDTKQDRIEERKARRASDQKTEQKQQRRDAYNAAKSKTGSEGTQNASIGSSSAASPGAGGQGGSSASSQNSSTSSSGTASAKRRGIIPPVPPKQQEEEDK